MARTKAISLIQSGSTKVDLAELSGLVIQNIQKDTLSAGLKSQSYTGNPATGSVEYKRFKNSADLLVLPGDSVVLKRFGRDNPSSQILLLFQVVGRPAIYATHQEIRVKDGDLA